MNFFNSFFNFFFFLFFSFSFSFWIFENEWKWECWCERRREKRELRFVRLEKTFFPKSQSPLDWKLLKMKNDENEWQSSKRRNNTKMREKITNREVKADPVVDSKPEIKHSLAGLDARVREAPLSWLTQHEANWPTRFNEQRLEIVWRSACVSSPSTTIIINTITPIIIRMDVMKEI